MPYFQILCLVGLADCLQAVNTQAVAAIGKSKMMFQWTVIKRGLGMSFMLGGLFFYGIKRFVSRGRNIQLVLLCGKYRIGV